MTDFKIDIDESPIDVLCLACDSSKCDFSVQKLQRRAMRPDDVVIDMKYCGVCHSDLHQAAGHMVGVMGKVEYPMVPGHELAGIVKAVGSAVTKFKVGDQIGVGCMVDSCQSCKACKAGEEQRCSKGQVGTYCGKDKFNGRAAQVPAGRQTMGGYTDVFLVNEKFGIKIPEGYPLEAAGPVMCAGVTMYDPLAVYGAANGTRVGIVGLGGLGQMGVKVAKARGCKVTVISRSAGKKSFAEKCGADDFVVSSDPSTIAGSGIGGVRATQEVMDLCAAHGITPDVEVVPVTQINRVYEALDKNNDSGIRYVLDIAGTLKFPEQCPKEAMGVPPVLSPPPNKIGIFNILGEVLKLLFGFHWK